MRQVVMPYTRKDAMQVPLERSAKVTPRQTEIQPKVCSILKSFLALLHLNLLHIFDESFLVHQACKPTLLQDTYISES